MPWCYNWGMDIEGKSQQHNGQLVRFKLEIDSMRHQVQTALMEYNGVLSHQIDDAIRNCIDQLGEQIACAVRSEIVKSVDRMVRDRIDTVLYSTDVTSVVEDVVRKKISKEIKNLG